MLLRVTFLVIFLVQTKCDWVEITVPKSESSGTAQAHSRVSFPTKNSNFVETTSPTYETIMRRPATLSSLKVSTFVPEFRYDVYDTQNQKNKSFSSRSKNRYRQKQQQPNPFATIHKNNEIPSSTSTTTKTSRTLDYDSNNEDTTDNGFLSFLKTIQKTLIKKSQKSISSKIAVLQNLRDELLYDIQERMSQLYDSNDNREARGYKDDDYHMDFPSNEGALMTISFLTFAVFLIKLVLKLIYALKYKNQQATTTVAPTMAGAIIIGRRKRDDSSEEANRILQLIEEYTIS